MPEIQSLIPVDLRELWGNETHDFTPWLVDNIVGWVLCWT